MAAPDVPLLQVRGLCKNYGAVQAVREIDLTIHEHELCGILGPNGSGKSTFFDCCMGLQRPSAGKVLLDGRDITRWPMHRIARKGRMIRSFQKTVVFGTMTPMENLIAAGQMSSFGGALATFSMGPGARRRVAALRERAEALIESIDLVHVRDQPAAGLSFGQQKLLQFATSVMSQPRLILLDEPLAGINPVLIERVIKSIRMANREFGITFVIIEHNIDAVMDICGRVIVFDQGVLLEDGEPQQVIRSPRVVEAYLGG